MERTVYICDREGCGKETSDHYKDNWISFSGSINVSGCSQVRNDTGTTPSLYCSWKCFGFNRTEITPRAKRDLSGNLI